MFATVPADNSDPPILIVGQGLAGSLLAWQLLRRGRAVSVVDRVEATSASRVAAGLISPVGGRRLTQIEGCSELLPAALSCYRRLGRQLGRRLYRPLPLWRRFVEPQQQTVWRKRCADPAYAAVLRGGLPPGGDVLLNAPLGGFRLAHCGQLDLLALLEGVRTELQTLGVHASEPFRHADLDASGPVLRWRGLRCSQVVFCEGQAASSNPWWRHLPFQPCQGEILTLRSDRDLPRAVISDGHWLLPLDRRRCRVGSNYQWRPLDCRPAPGVAEGLLRWTQTLFATPPRFEIEAHSCGIRPALRGTRPALGCHPRDPRIAIFNGLGARGSLLAPWCSERLVELLLDGRPLPTDIDVRRFPLNGC